MPTSTDTPTDTARRRRIKRRWSILLGILLLLAYLFEFDPFHPILWMHHIEDAFRQGHQARLLDDSIAAADAARRRAARQHPTPLPTPLPAHR